MSENVKMYVTSASESGSGIYIYDLDTTSGAMQPAGAVADMPSGLYLNRHPTRPLLYAVGPEGVGSVYAFGIKDDGGLSLINRQPSNGGAACYVSVGGEGQSVLIVNYTGSERRGSIATYPIQAGGGLAPPVTYIQLAGNGPNEKRQEASHPHMIVPTPDDNYVLVPDLGTDKVMVYRLNRETGALEPHTTPHIAIEAGSGPRHLAFDPVRPFLYVLSELKPMLTVVAYDAAAGTFEPRATYPTLPKAQNGGMDIYNLGADIHVTPSGKFLYATNRGHNVLSIFAISDDGTLAYVGEQSTLGDWPRSFVIDPSGRILIVANRRTHDLYTFMIDPDTGELTPTGHKAEMPDPVCVKCI